MGNPENWLHWAHKTQDKDKQKQHRILKRLAIWTHKNSAREGCYP